MADKYGYEPITSAPVLTAEEIARRNIARSRQEAARKEEAEKRRLALIAEAKRQASQKKRPAPDENEDRPRSRPSTFSTVPDAITESDIPPKTVKVDDVEMPLDEAVAKIPEQMDFEEFVRQPSPLTERALARARTEELTAGGMAPEKAAEQARQEREKRQAAFERGREAIRKEPATADKEGRGFAESVTSGVGAPIARMLGFGQAANEAEARAAGVQAELSQFRDERYAHPQIAGAVAGAAQNTAQMGPGIAASMLGGPAVGMAVMSGQFGSQEYSRAAYEGAEAGLAGAELNQYALIQAGVEASIMPIMSKIPGMAGIEGRVLRQSVARGVAAHPTIRKALSGAGTLAKDTAAEVTEEVITEVLHGFASEGMLNEDVDYKAVIGDTVLQTLVMMGMTEGVTQAGRLMDAGRKSQPELTQPDQQIQQYETPVLKNPAIDAFIANPGSAKLYEAAVASGMAPLPNPNRTERRKYAAGLKQLSQDPAPQPELQNEASSAAMPPVVETPSGMVPDSELDEMFNVFEGSSNGQEANVTEAQSNREDERASEEKRQESKQGRQEGLLEPPVKEGFVRVYHSGSAGDGDGDGGRWVSTLKDYASKYRPNSPLLYMDVPANDPRVNNPDFDDQGIKNGFTFNFELSPDEAKQLRQIDRSQETPSGTEGMTAAASPNDSAVSPASKSRMEIYQDTLKDGKASDKLKADMAQVIRSAADEAVPQGTYSTFGGDPSNAQVMAKLDAVREHLESQGHTVGPVTHNKDAGTSSMTIEARKETVPDQPTPPELASGELSPVQSAPSLAGPVSTQEATPVATGVPSPDQSSKETGPVSETPRRGIVGDMLTTGEVVQTASGRSTTPFPKIALDTNRKLSMTLRKAEEWLQSNALAEAESRGDEFNALQFRNEKPGKMPKATKDAMEEYLFGEQPAVVPSILKPLVKPGVQKQEPIQTVAGKMTYDEFEAKGYSPEQVTKQDWVNLQKSLRRSLGQPESSGTAAAPFADWEEFHRDAVAKAVKAGDEVDEEVLADYPDLKPASKTSRDRILAAVKQVNPRVQSGDMVSIADIRAAVGMEPAEFDATMQQLVKDKVLAAHRFDRPGMVSDEQRQQMLKLGDAYHNTVSLWENEPGDRERINQMMDDAESKKPEAPAEPSQEDLMEQILREELLGEAPEKPKKERKPRTPKTDTGEPKASRKPRTEAAKKRTERTAAELKAAEDDIRKAFGSTANMGLNPEQMRATARLVKAALNHQVSTFNEFVAYVVDTFGEPLALKMADGIELAWRTLKRLPEYSGIDEAGKVADVINQKEKAKDENRPERDESTADGGSETAGRPVGQERMEETAPTDVPADGEGGDAGRRGTASGERSDGETSGTAQPEDEGTGSVPASPAGNDRTSGRSGRLNYRIAGDDKIGEKFHPKERFDKNVQAIKVLKQVESENRRATAEEQKILAQYVGWGGLKEAFSTREDQGLREKAILKELLTEQELSQARMSVRNAHYTSPEVIAAMWEGLTDAGFSGGRILEPSMGIGHFYGLVPESVAAVSKLSGIEMDSLTARIAQQLYQVADIQHSPYERVNVKNLQDLVISNVPFGQYKASDKYDKSLKHKESIHNFFFLKALKNVRPGGVVAFITSRYTMDSVDPSVREKITAAGGRFVGAVRLPNNTFMGIAKTKVTTDVIFIQKDTGDAQPWRNTRENAAGFVFNEYFHDHPENVLGKIDPKGGTQIGEWGLAPDSHDIGKELAQKIAAMPFDRAAIAENSTEDAEIEEDAGENADVPDGRLAIRDNKLFKAVGGKLEEVPLWGGERGQERKFAIIRSMGSLAAVRDKLSDLEMSPLATDVEIERARKLLNTTYDRFVKEHGFIHKGENQGLFRPDEQLPTLLALEEWDTDTKTAKKADVFEKRVQRPSSATTTPTTAEGAAVESYARLGRVDLPMISEWLGKSEAQVENELTGWAYKDPATGGWFLKNVYLSGNIAKKLKEAEAAAKKDPAFQKNVEDLKRVLPPRKTAGQIHVRARSPFVTADHYHQFMQHLGVNGEVRHDEFTGAWVIDNPHIEDAVKAGPWGVGRNTAADLLDGLLNNKPPVVWMKDYNGNRVVDPAATQLARSKAKEIEDEFGNWIFSDPDRAKQIEDGFNDTVGAYIEGEWDGSHLTLPGMNVNITLLPHQKNAIWRAIVTGNIMLAHEVGLGKTFIMAAIAMERKRLGLVTNQMFVVPNHLLSQWASEFKALYPSAKLLALESDQINSKNRRTLMERVKSGRFDAIIVTPEAYKKMPMSNEIVEAKLKEITQKIEDTIKEARKAKGDNKNFVAKLESVLDSIRGKMEVMLNDPAKDAGAKFDELGIDAIYVDEAHEYRNLWSMTQMGDISGVGLDGNQKTFDMLLKTDYLNQKTNNRGIVFATGTPIANSISELYSMQRYLQPQMLADAGVASFDDWANTFGEAVTDIEVDPTGSGFRSKTRFKEFRNTIALSKLFRQIADVKYADDPDVGLDKVRPKLRGGKLHAIQVMPSLGLLDFVRNLVRRLEISKSRSFDKRIDNPLKVTTDGRKAALDMRLVVPEEDGISSKINHAVENVARIYREEDERKGAQLLWVNLGTPASAKKRKSAATLDPDADPTAAKMDSDEAGMESGRINAYEDIKQKLIAQGIPENEIAFIHDYDDKDRKRALFQKVREGKVRIVISTVKKLATGANIQTRMAAMHFLDPPWKPADIEQALGRAIRRGNKYKDWGGVQAFTYVTRGSFDAYIWQLLENKAKAIKQIMRGESDSVEDTGRIELNADEVKALASSNPKVLELVKVRNEVGQLRAEFYGYRAEQGNIQSGIATHTNSLKYYQNYLDGVEAELKKMPSRDDLHSDFKVTIGGKVYSKRSEIGAALIEAMPEIDADKTKSAEQIKELAANPVKIGSVLGKPLFASRSDYNGKAQIIIGSKDGEYFNPSDDNTGNGVKLFNYFDKKYDEPSRLKAKMAETQAELTALKDRAGKPWPKGDRLTSSEESLRQLELELGADAGKKDALPVVSALTKFAIMAEKLGRQQGRPVTFDGTQWTHGDRTPVNIEAVTAEMEAEVDREVALLLSDSKEASHSSFFFQKSKERQAADKSKAELSALQLMNRQHDKVILSEFKKALWGRGSTAWTGLPITDEMARAIVGRMIGSVRAGVKQFEVFIRELRASHPEELVRSIKPNLIRTWNALKDKYDLDDAMDVAFEAAVTDTKDVDIEQAIEAAKGETTEEPQPAEMPESQPADGRLYSTKNAMTDQERVRLGMEERVPLPRQSREAQIEYATAYGKTEAGRNVTNELIAELSVTPRSTSVLENDLLSFRYAELDQARESAMTKKNAARRAGDNAQVAVQDTLASNILKQQTELVSILSLTVSYALGSGMQARKALINTDFTMARSVLEFEAAYGREPNAKELEAMQKQIDDLKAGQAELQKLLDEANAKNDDLETRLKDAHDSAVAAEQTPAPPAPKQTILQAMGERGRNRINSAKKRIMEMLRDGKSFSIGGVVDEAGKAFLELATGYTEIGIVTVADFLKQLRRDFGPSFDKVKDPALAAFNQVQTSSTTGELDAITSRIDILDPDTIGKAARNLHSFVIRRDGLDASAAGREAAVDAVHQILADFVPGITPEEVARAMSGIGIYSELSKDEAEIVRRDQKAQLLSLQQIADWKKGQAPPATGMERPPISDEQRALRRAVNEAKKAAGIVEATAGQLRSALDAAKRMARNRITDLTKAIESGQRIAVSRKLLQPDAELTALQAERDALQQLYDEAFGKRELSDEQRLNMAEKALDRAIADLESDLKAGKLYPDAPGPQVTSPAIEAKREILDALKASRDELRLQSGEAQARSDAAYERMLMERGARLAQKIADQDFAPPEKKPERELTPAMLKQMLANQKMQQKIQSERRKWEFDNKHIVYKAMTWGPVATAAIIRKGLTTFDQSLIGRQGYLLGITNLWTYGKAIRKAFPSNVLEAKSLFPTEQDLFNTQAALDADANWVRLEKIAKLAVTDVHGGLNREEENQFVPEWVNKIPGAAGSERAGSAFINTLRRLVFRSLVDKLSKTMDGKNKTISNADLRVIGNLVNVASGRGNIGNWSAAIKGMSSVFFSPSWWASRLAWWSGQPMWQDARWTGGEGASPEVRQLVAMEMGKQFAAQAAIIGLVAAGLAAAFGPPGDDEEWDFYWNPISPNFGKMRVGNTMIDMTAGLGQHLSFFARMLTGMQSDRWEMNEVNRGRLFIRYGRGKLAPIPGAVADFIAGSDMEENKVGSGEWAKGKVLPLMVQDVMDASQKEGLPMAPVISALMFFGIGAQSYDERVRERKETVNEVRALQKQGKPQSEIDALLNKHFASQAAKEAKEALRTAEPEEAAKLETIASETESPELTEAIQKEKGDLVLVASVMLSTEDKTKDRKSPDEDKSITTARDLLKAVAPTYEDAAKLYTEAYKRRNGSITELVGPKGKKRYVVKKNVVAARRRLKAMYEK